MASFGNSQNPWASSYDTYKDCSQGFCSIYCPQWCYLVFPPPPPISAGAGIDSDSGDGDGGDRDFSPLIIAVVGILASAFILLSYYTIVAKYCRRRRRRRQNDTNDNDNEGGGNDGGDAGRAGGGLDAGLIRSIKVYRYKRSERVVALADCAVCLSEFEENDRLRVLPKCSHAFHVACIDAWLGSHSSCPLCRSNINDVSSELSKSVVRGSEPVVVVVVVEEEDGSEIGVRREEEALEPKSPVRSASFGLGSARLLVADILRQEEQEDEEENGIIPFWFGNVGTSSNRDDHDDRDQFCGTDLGLMRSPLASRRSNSSGRFVFTRYGEAKNSVLPN